MKNQMRKIRLKKVPLKIRLCPQVAREHQLSCRQFAHVFHHVDQICVCPEFYDLPEAFMVGILLHEIGHYGCQDRDHTEGDADYMAFLLSGVRVVRRSLHGAKRLETVHDKDIDEAKRFLREYLG